jgi:hypothetical protein
VYADGVNILDGNTNTIKKNEAQSEASSEIGLEVNAGTIKYMVMSYYQNVGQNHKLLINNKSSENVEKFKYMGTLFYGVNTKCESKVS